MDSTKKMVPFHLEQDIKVMYVTAETFPNGVERAHEKLHSMIPFTEERKYFGLSRPERGTIVYHAAAEELQSGEGDKLELNTLTVRKGNYVAVTVRDYMKDLPAIGQTFQEILARPGVDPEGYCVEWYINHKDVMCMVRQADQ